MDKFLSKKEDIDMDDVDFSPRQTLSDLGNTPAYREQIVRFIAQGLTLGRNRLCKASVTRLSLT